jgi:hypothetical protein
MTGTKNQNKRYPVCARCRHPWPLHENGAAPCRARGCHAGPDAAPCPRWLAPETRNMGEVKNSD